MDEKLLDTIEGTAETLSVSRSTVYELLNQKELDGVKIGRSHRVVVESSRRYVERLKGADVSGTLETA
jgi:excisionase family DNA binding protein